MQKKLTLGFFFALFAIITLFPISWMFGSSLYEKGSFSFTHYRDIFLTQKYVEVILRSLLFASVTAVFSALAGIPAGFFLAKTDFPLKKLFKLCFFIPIIIPSYTIGIAWTNILGKAGFFNHFLAQYTFLTPQHLYDFIYSTYGAAFILSMNLFPLIMIMTEYAFLNVPPHLEESALMTGSFLQVLWKITLPLVSPVIFSGIMIVFVIALSEFGVPSLLQLNVLTTQIFTQFSAFYNEKAATAIAFPLILITILVFIFEQFTVNSTSFDSMGRTGSRSSKTYCFTWIKITGLLFSLTIFITYIVLPFCSLFLNVRSIAVYKDAFSMAKKGILNSLIFGCIGASLLTLTGFFLGYLTEKTPGKLKQGFSSFIWLFFAVPATVIGIGLIKLWNRPHGISQYIYGSLGIIIIGYIIRFAPLSTRIMANFFKQVPRSMEEAGTVAGASWLRIVGNILVPLQKYGIIATWIITFIFCIGELGTTILVYPPGHETLPIALFTIMANSPENIVSALTVILIGMTLLPVSIFFLISKYVFAGKMAA